ncbi:protein RALF-like 33 [Pyrus communis]|uniref:protein RALF-like 33 n=1 Tax=Pyrus communis TaxID=23211 RepID=UPI0035C1A563
MGISSSRTPSLFGCIFICAILAAHLVVIASALAVDFIRGHQLGELSGGSTRSAAGGLIADEDEDAEMQMDSEINRRILATRTYISYGALNRNTVPCSRRGASYYNCIPRAPARHRSPANPYRLGCSAVTRCRR